MLDDTPAIDRRARYAAARAAQPVWAARPVDERIEAIRTFRAHVVRPLRRAGRRSSPSETGKPISQRRNELNGLLPRIDFFLDRRRPTPSPTRSLLDDAMRASREVISHEPLGVIANISAWNYPYFVGSNVFVPALLTGNAVLYKPSEHATAHRARPSPRCCGDAGVPERRVRPGGR